MCVVIFLKGEKEGRRERTVKKVSGCDYTKKTPCLRLSLGEFKKSS